MDIDTWENSMVVQCVAQFVALLQVATMKYQKMHDKFYDTLICRSKNPNQI